MLAMFEAMFVFESNRKTNNIKHNRTISTKVEHENRFLWRAAACLWAGASGQGFSRGAGEVKLAVLLFAPPWRVGSRRLSALAIDRVSNRDHESGITCNSDAGRTATCPVNGRSCARINSMAAAKPAEKSPIDTAEPSRL
jgi:hypothetical protein